MEHLASETSVAVPQWPPAATGQQHASHSSASIDGRMCTRDPQIGLLTQDNGMPQHEPEHHKAMDTRPDWRTGDRGHM